MVSLHRGLWLDEYTTLLLFKHETLAGAMGALRYDTHHPLYFALLYEWHHLPCGLVMWRCLSMCFYWFHLGALWRIGRQYGGLQSALWAMTLGGMGPLILRFSTELRPYSLLCCLTAWSALLVVARRPTAGQHSVDVSADTPPATLQYVLLQVATAALVCTHPVGVFAAIALWPLAQLTAPVVMRTPGGWRLNFANCRRHAFSGAVVVASFGVMRCIYSLHRGNDGITWMPNLSWRVATRTTAELVGFMQPTSSIGVWGALLLFVVAGLQGRVSRAFLLAALTHVAMVVAYSLAATSIFIPRALSPAWVYLTLAAALGVGSYSRGMRHRFLCLLFAGVIVMQLMSWWQLGKQDVDPAHAVGVATRQAFQTGDTIWAYPDWFDTAIRAEQTDEAAPYVFNLPGPNVHQKGVLVVRLDFAGADVAGGLVSRMNAADSIRPHTIVYYASDDDNVLADERERELVKVEAQKVLQKRFVGCSDPIDRGRYSIMSCPSGM